MKVTLSWLREFTPVDAEPAEVARALSFLGLVVEATEHVPAPLAGIVVARVLETKPHPDADRIQLVDVDAGDGQALQICCGAFNMKAGDLVPLATLGTVMPSGIEIARRKMRGQWSNGMLCSVSELELGPEGDKPGIYILEPEAGVPGQPVNEVLGLGPDVVFDIDVSPNRSDCFSVAGIARDLAAALSLPFQLMSPPSYIDAGVATADVGVDDEARPMCRRFTGTLLTDVGSARVPAVVARRLALCGMRPINPIVDVSNYVMLELGQPNHPYDLDHLGGRALRVRRAGEGEVLVTLDGVTRELVPSDCVIADGEGRAVGLAGVMGGAAAEISTGTNSVLLEVANFAPAAVAATGKRLGLSSEARTRFERGVDIEVAGLAIDRFVQLMGGEVRRGPTSDVRSTPSQRALLHLRTARANLLLGTDLSTPECARALGALGFGTSAVGDGLDVEVPTWRPDCGREVDLVEEIARIHGYDKIERAMPSRPISAGGLSAHQKRRRYTRDILAGTGASEVWTSTYLSGDEIARAGLDRERTLALSNPLDQSQGLLRPSLLPGLLGALRTNRERQAGVLCLFEIGHVFAPASYEGAGSVLVPGVSEKEQMAVVAYAPGIDASWAVRAWQVLASALRLEEAGIRSGQGDGVPEGVAPSALAAVGALHPGRRGLALAGGQIVGVLGEVSPDVAEAVGLEGRVAVLVADLAPLLGSPSRSWEARSSSRFPASDLDMAFVVADGVSAGALEATVRAAIGALGEAIGLFDVWRGAPLGEGRRSLAFRVRLRDSGRTLTEQDVAEARQAIAARALEEHGAVLRTG